MATRNAVFPRHGLMSSDQHGHDVAGISRLVSFGDKDDVKRRCLTPNWTAAWLFSRGRDRELATEPLGAGG